MKNLNLIFLHFIILFSFFSTAQAADTKVLFVKVKTSMLRTSPDFLSGASTNVKYGDALSVINSSLPWHQVKLSSGKSGYIHNSAVSTRAVILDPSLSFNATKKNSKNIVMAGKGFNKKVENSYKKLNKNLNYSAVDRMEKTSISNSELKTFASKGKLN